jgi:hypothetical protein
MSLQLLEKIMRNNPEKERHKMNFGFLLFDNLEELDLVGPWEIISIFNAG